MVNRGETTVEFAKPHVRIDQLHAEVIHRTGRKVRNLRFELLPEAIRITGVSSSYYAKQLVTHAVCQAAPQFSLRNEISVED